MNAPNNGRKTSPSLIAARERAAVALKLRKQGKTFAEIARLAGYNTVSAAHDAVKKAIAAITSELANELVSLELARLDLLWRPHWKPACAGNPRALDACLRIMDRRAKLVGLYAPVKKALEIEHYGGVLVVPGLLDEGQ